MTVDWMKGRGVIAAGVNTGGDLAIYSALQPDGTLKQWGKSGSTDVPVRDWALAVGKIAAIAEGQVITSNGLQGRLSTDSNLGNLVLVNNHLSATMPFNYKSASLIGTSSGSFLLVTQAGDLIVEKGLNDAAMGAIPTTLAGAYIKAGVQQIASSQANALALLDDGTVEGWGDNLNGEATIPAGLSGVTQVQCGANHSVALKGDGTVVAWGDNSLGQCNVPAGLTGVQQISACGYGDFTVALKSDGTVVAWGDNSKGQCNVPVGLTAVTKIAAGDYHVLTIGSGGFVCWGDNTHGQCPSGLSYTPSDIAATFQGSLLLDPGTSYGMFYGESDAATGNPASIQTPITAVHGYPDCMLGVAADGTPHICGLGNVGNLLIDAAGVMVGKATTYALRKDGSLALVDGTSPSGVQADIYPPPGTDFVAVYPDPLQMSATWYVKSDGTIGLFGYNTAAVTNPQPSPAASNVKALAIGESARLALLKDGTLQAWGDNTNGACNIPAGITAAFCVGAFALANNDDSFEVLYDNGKVAAWGGVGDRSSWYLPGTWDDYTALYCEDSTIGKSLGLRLDGTVVVSGNTIAPYQALSYKFDNIAASAAVIASQKDTGALITWGDSSSGEGFTAWPSSLQHLLASVTHVWVADASGALFEWTSSTASDNTIATQPISSVGSGLLFSSVASIALGPKATLAVVTSTGAVQMWGADATTNRPPSGVSGNQSKVAAGYATYLALSNTGVITAWGNNGDGQLTNAPAATGFLGIAAGHRCCLAIKPDNTVQGWGYNGNGETTIPAGLSGVAKVVASCDSATGDLCGAIRSDGTVVLWGYNSAQSWMAVPAGLTGVDDLSLMSDHAVAHKSDGTFVQWGSSSVATPPAGLTGIVAARATRGGGIALKNDGTLVAWGTSADPGRVPVAPKTPVKRLYAITASGSSSAFYTINSDDSLSIWGLADQPRVGLPGVADVLIQQNLVLTTAGTVEPLGRVNGAHPSDDIPAGLSGVAALKAGASFAVALKGDGSVAAWGINSNGQTNVPAGLANVQQIACGDSHTLALKGDGTVTAWGANASGQCNVPAGLGVVTQVDAAQNCSVALLQDGTVAAWGSNTFGESTVPAGLTSVSNVYAGAYQTNYALRDDGTVVAWGRFASAVPAGLAGVAFLRMGERGSLSEPVAAIRTDGTAVVFGNDAGTAQSTIPPDNEPITLMGIRVGNQGVLTVAISLSGSGYSGAPAVLNLTLDDRLALAAAATPEQINVLRERLAMAGGQTALLTAFDTCGERLGFVDLVGIAYRILLGETIKLLGDQSAWTAMALELVDALAVAAGAGSMLDAQVAVAAAMAFGDSLARLFPAGISESVKFSAAQVAQLRAMLKVLDTLRMQAALSESVQFFALVDEQLAAASTVAAAADLLVLINEGVDLLAQITLDDGVYLAWVLNTESRAYTRYSNFNFNSFAKIGEKYYGARDDGLYLLEGDNDAGAPINAFLRSGLSDLGTSLLKRQHCMYLGYTAAGRLLVKVTMINKQGLREEHWYSVEERPAGALRKGRVKIGKGLASTYWEWELANVDGADFALDSIAWYPMILERRLN